MTAPHTLKLMLQNGQNELVPLAKSRMVVGRTKGDIVLDDMGVFDPHLEIWLVGTHYFVKPIAPTLLDGNPLKVKAQFNVGSVLTLGSSALELLPPLEMVDGSKGGFSVGKALALLILVGGLAGGGYLTLNPDLRMELRARAVKLTGGEKSPLLSVRSVTQPFAWVKKVDDRYLGGVSNLHLTFSPGDTRGVTIAFKETAAGATGNQWRAAAWLAAFNAERATQKFDEPLSFTIQADDDVDGPSASMLMSVSFMAMLRGEALLSDRLVSATVNPDGTAGPVGGLNEKVKAAGLKGLKKFGVAKATDPLPNVAGVEVVPLANLLDAYEFMTGVALPRAAAVEADEMALPGGLEAKLLALTDQLTDAAEKRAVEIEKEAQVGAGVDMLYELSDACRNTVSSSRKYKSLGYAAAAYTQAIAASSSCAMGSEVLSAYRNIRRGNFSAVLLDYQDKRDPERELGKLAGELDKVVVKNLDQQLLHLNAYAQLSAVGALIDQAGAVRKAREKELKLVGGNARMCQRVETLGSNCITAEALEVALTMRLLRAGALSVIDSTRALGVGGAGDIEKAAAGSSLAPLKAAEFEALSTSYSVGARAVLAYFDSLFTDELAKALGISRGLAQSRMAGADMSYLVAYAALDRAQGGASPSAQERFAAASTAYLSGAALVNRYFMTASDAARGDPKAADARLNAQLDEAKAAALQAAGRAKAELGFVPLSARAAFLEARGFATGSRAERHEALTAYWSSALWSDLAASLKR